jgi:hypothetical protein
MDGEPGLTLTRIKARLDVEERPPGPWNITVCVPGATRNVAPGTQTVISLRSTGRQPATPYPLISTSRWASCLAPLHYLRAAP